MCWIDRAPPRLMGRVYRIEPKNYNIKKYIIQPEVGQFIKEWC